MMYKVIFLIGPPGSGKGTQAELLAKELGFSHLETSKIIEERFENADPKDKEILHQREHWLAGELFHPEVIIRWVTEEVEKHKDSVSGFIFSGSPRWVEEARHEAEYLEKIYGKENIAAVEIRLSEEESVKRNSSRRICEKNRHPIPNFPEYENIVSCPEDGSKIVTRELDKPELIRDRFQVYLRDTAPVIEYFRENGYKVVEVNGEQPIEKVFEDIISRLNATQ